MLYVSKSKQFTTFENNFEDFVLHGALDIVNFGLEFTLVMCQGIKTVVEVLDDDSVGAFVTFIVGF